MYEACKIIKKLGEGTFSRVFLCHNVINQTYFVVKKIPWSVNDFVLSSVQKEYLFLSRLRHPRLIHYLGFYQSPLSWNFILEYAQNGSLAEVITSRIKCSNFFSFKDILNIFIDILAGIKYLHYCCIVHRDLKPDNILLDKYCRAKISDFGISRFVTSKTELCMTNIGTPYYMAPEVIQGLEYGFKCDIWSMGIILFEICTLQHPFKVSDVFLDGSQYPKLSSISFRPGLYDLCEHMLKIDVDKRANIDDLVNHFLIVNKFCAVFLEN